MATKIIIILQARSDPNRLPYKTLSLFKNIPLAVLCAKRLKNSNRKLIVAASLSQSDDYLCNLLKKNGINFTRGSLNNFFSRHCEICKNFKENDLIIRATADNPFVDGKIVEILIKEINKKKLNYLSINKLRKKHNLPYGISLEILKFKELLRLKKKKLNKYDLEHVTTRMRDKNTTIEKLKMHKRYSSLNVSVNDLLDYKKISRIFDSVKMPYEISWKTLVKKFYILKNKESFYTNSYKSKSFSKLILGAAQFGFKYGSIKNKKKIKRNKLVDILKFSNKNKINMIDTARSYGDSEKNIGEITSTNKNLNFKIITKIKSIANIEKKSNNEICTKIFQSIYESCKFLNVNKLENITIHNSSNFFKRKKIFLKCLKESKNKKFVNNFGVSIYSPNELYKLIKLKDISFLQIPINILDQRWNIKKIQNNKNNKIKIFARSIFLRGLLFLKSDLWPYSYKNNLIIKNRLNNLIKKFKKKNVIDLTFAYLNSINFINGIVVGFHSIKQLKMILKFQDSPKLKKKELSFLSKQFSSINRKILDARNY